MTMMKRIEDVGHPRMTALAKTFPTLQNAAGIVPWDPVVLDDWAKSGAPGSGAKAAAQFVLSLWNPDTRWPSGRFNVHDALSVWDFKHRQAFIGWANAPWWP